MTSGRRRVTTRHAVSPAAVAAGATGIAAAEQTEEVRRRDGR
jgi:hypothetical protein